MRCASLTGASCQFIRFAFYKRRQCHIWHPFSSPLGATLLGRFRLLQKTDFEERYLKRRLSAVSLAVGRFSQSWQKNPQLRHLTKYRLVTHHFEVGTLLIKFSNPPQPKAMRGVSNGPIHFKSARKNLVFVWIALEHFLKRFSFIHLKFHSLRKLDITFKFTCVILLLAVTYVY